MATRITIVLKDGQAAVLDLAPPPITELNLGGWTNPIGQLKDWIVDKLASVARAVWDIIRQAWDAIISAIKAGVDWLVSGLKEALRILSTLAETVKNAVVGALRKAWDGILSGIHTIVGWIRDTLGKVWEVLQKVASGIERLLGIAWDKIPKAMEFIANLAGRLEDWLRDLSGVVVEKVMEAFKTIWDKIRETVEGIRKGLGEVLTLITGLMGRVAEVVAEAVKKAWDAVASGFQATLGWIRDALGKVWEVLQRIGAVVMDAVGAVATAFLGAIRDFFGGIAEVVWGAVKRLASAVESAFSWVAERIRGVLLFVWDQILKLAPRSTEEVPTKLPALIGVLGMAGVSTMVALDAAGIQVVGSGISLDGIKGYLKDVFSPGLVQGVLIGTVLTSGIGPFVSRWVSSTFRTWLPSPQEAYVMWRQGYISISELREILRQHGTPEGWLAARMDLADYTPPIAELMRVAQYTDLDLGWLEGKLAENGVSEDDTPMFLELFFQAALRRVHTEIWGAIESAVSYGVPSEAAVSQYLSQARLRSFLQPYYLLAYTIRLNTQRVRWWLEAWEEQLYRGLIEPEDFVEKALSLGVDKSYAMARAAYQMARRGILWIPPSG